MTNDAANDAANNISANTEPKAAATEPKAAATEPKAAATEPKASEPSICIPRVFKSMMKKDIYDVCEKLELGAVDRIDMVAKTNDRGECYNKVFIHFKTWNKKSEVAQATRAQLLRGEEVKIVYSEPWFWKCSASRVEKPTFRDYSAPPPRIDLGGCASLSANATQQQPTATVATITKEEP
jgi:hypothetical protein